MRSHSPTGRRLAIVATLTTVALAVSACAGYTPILPPSTAAPTALGIADDQLAAALDRIPEAVAHYLDLTGVPGLAIAVVHGGSTVYAEGFGTANLDTGAAVDANTVFPLASVSKPVGATVIAAAAREGELSWSTPIAGNLPGFALSDPWVTDHVTLGDFYSHRTGLPDHSGDDLAVLGVDQATIIDRQRLLPLHDFRLDYAYSNFGIQTGALTVGQITDTGWAELSDELIYGPLGMDRTTSSFDVLESMSNRALSHRELDGVWQVSAEQFDDDDAAAAGGVASTVTDMAAWLTMVLNDGRGPDGETIADPTMLAEAMIAQTPMPMDPLDPGQPRGAYGFGFQLGVLSGTSHALVSHSGAFAQGAGTSIVIVPALDIAVVVLTNGFPIGLAETVAMETIDVAVTGELSRDWWTAYSDALAAMTNDYPSAVAGPPPSDPAAAPPASELVGTYTNDYFGEAVVAESGGVLTLELRPTPTSGQTWQLEPYDGATFRVLLDIMDATPNSVSAVVFDPGAGTVTFEYFDVASGGLGTLTRSR